MNCPNCGEPMPKVFDNGLEGQVLNGAIVGIDGYYGGFFDEFLANSKYTTICHDCTVRLLEQFPAFAAMLEGHRHKGHRGDCCDWAWPEETC